jgi:hypothetical protein
MFLRGNVYYHQDPDTGILLYFDNATQEWKPADHDPGPPNSRAAPPPARPANIERMRDPAYNQQTNPYSQIIQHDLAFNNYNTYVVPLEEQEMIKPTQPKNNYVDPSDVQGTQAMSNAWKEMKPSPVQTNGLQTIETTRIEEPSENPEMLKRKREMEDAQLRIPRCDPAALRPIDCNGRIDNSRDVVSFKSLRDQDLQEVPRGAPPPETVQCGFSEYQGGATWEDINRYRDQEMNTLLEIQEKQRSGNEPVYYY